MTIMKGHFTARPLDYDSDNKIIHPFEEPKGSYAGYLYDACWTLVDAVERLKERTSNALGTIRGSNVTRFKQIIRESDFYGVT